jgi:hypothetical protein
MFLFIFLASRCFIVRLLPAVTGGTRIEFLLKRRKAIFSDRDGLRPEQQTRQRGVQPSAQTFIVSWFDLASSFD